MYKPATASVSLSLFLLLPAGCTAMETVPETGRRRPELQYAEADLDRVGADAYREVLKRFQVIETGTNADMVRDVGKSIAAATNRNYEWEFKLLESLDSKEAGDHTVDAFCLPGGKVAVFSGILPVCDGEQGLAVVISHVIAHTTLQHGNERLSQPFWKRMAAIPVGASAGVLGGISPRNRKFVLDGLGLGFLVGQTTPYTEVQESEADEVGLRYMHKAGFDVDEAARFWRRMHAGKDQGSDFLRLHPGALERAKELERIAQRLKVQR